MDSFLLALQFLTIVPVRIKHFYEKKMAEALLYFPVIGLLLGLTLAGCAGLLDWMNLEPLSIDIVLVILLAVFTGGMHLDGLADTADAILSRKPKDEMLRIMRDSHTGVMGILSIIIIILLKIAFLYSIDRRMFIPALILMCVLSRWALVGLMFFFPYARQDGKAKIFIQGINYRIVLICSLITLGIVIVAWPFGGILVLLLAGLSAYSFARFINSKIGGITGDTLGAACEIVETAVLFSILFLRR